MASPLTRCGKLRGAFFCRACGMRRTARNKRAACTGTTAWVRQRGRAAQAQGHDVVVARPEYATQQTLLICRKCTKYAENRFQGLGQPCAPTTAPRARLSRLAKGLHPAFQQYKLMQMVPLVQLACAAAPPPAHLRAEEPAAPLWAEQPQAVEAEAEHAPEPLAEDEERAAMCALNAAACATEAAEEEGLEELNLSGFHG